MSSDHKGKSQALPLAVLRPSLGSLPANSVLGVTYLMPYACIFLNNMDY